MLLLAFFTDRGAPSVGLTPVVDIWETDGTQVVTAQAMTEVAGGWYNFDFAAYNPAKDYGTRADGGSGLASLDRYKAASNEALATAEHVWDSQAAAHTEAGSFGLTVSEILTDTAVTIPLLISSLNDLAIPDVQTALSNQGYTAARSALLDHLTTIVGLVQENFRMTATTYVNKVLTAATITIYPTRVDTDNETNPIAAYTLTAVVDPGGNVTDYKMTRNP